MSQCPWLPELIPCHNLGQWKEYLDQLYTIFCEDFIDDRPSFNGKLVNIRKHPMQLGKEEAFFHITCQDYNKDGERLPDLRRCERIKWVRSFIENYNCNPALCPDCEGIKVWSEPYGSYSRVHLLFEEERYMVVIEVRDTYCLLVTAFYFDQDHRLRKTLKKYQQCRGQ